MTNMVYAVHPFDTALTDDGAGLDRLLHDLAKDADELRTQALAASGDYFETLAARLEQIAAALPINAAEQHQLQEAVSQLLYLQRKYTITKKSQ